MKLIHRQCMLVVITLSMIPVFFVSKTVMTARAQQRDTKSKIIKKMSFPDARVGEPIEIVEVRSNGKVIKLDEAFDANEWMKDFTIRFKNVSGKTITFVSLGLRFRETAMAGEPFGVPSSHGFRYGQSASQQWKDPDLEKKLLPGEFDEVSLGAKEYEGLKKFIGQRMNLNEVTMGELTLESVYFDDGIQWSAGYTFRPDPQHPGKYIPIKNDE